MSETALKIENISKQYRLGVVGTQTLRGDLQRFWWKMQGKGDPTLKIGQENKLNERSGQFVWALRDINLDVKQGEVLGIIGKNGAGKSTLLKILARVTGPTTGNIKINGRIASLLEVGTGFHPELTGRENIFLNGAILGMRKWEIQKKLDEIVDFAGVAKYLDTPVKRYSSGMYVRLGFAVAAHLEPEILIVDEVLAVGDAEFQKKAIGKMQDISHGQGRTVLFVSHNMASIENLCDRAILLKEGKINSDGKTNEVIRTYTSSKIQKPTERLRKNEPIFFEEILISLNDGLEKREFLMGDTIKIKLKISFWSSIVNSEISFFIKNKHDTIVTHVTNMDSETYLSGNKNEIKTIEITTSELYFSPGIYSISFWAGKRNETYCFFEDYAEISIIQSNITKRYGNFPPHVISFMPTTWKIYEN